MSTVADSPDASQARRPRRFSSAMVVAALVVLGSLLWWGLSSSPQYRILVDSPDATHGYIGNPYAGDATGNSLLFKHEASRRFLAQHTGEVDRVRHNNRTLLDLNISQRCEAKPDSQWCRCAKNGLDAYTCGYHIPNSYSIGNGGLISVEIREDDGTPEHLPKTEALGRTQVPYVPMEIKDDVFPTFLLEAPVKLEKGKLYHLVYRQLRPPKCDLGHLPPEQAANCERDAGAVGLNGLFFFSRDAYKDGGPLFKESAANLYRQAPDEPWKRDPDNLSWYLLGYTDGQWHGHAMDFYRSYDKYLMRVDGDKRVRQRFEIASGIKIESLWVRVSREEGASDLPLSVQIKDDDNEVLTTLSVAASDVTQCKQCGGKWLQVVIPGGLTTESNGVHFVEFSAPAAADYKLPTGFELSYKPYKAHSDTFWTNARVEFSHDGGQTWEIEPGNAYAAERDLSLLLSVPLPRQP